MGKKRRADAVDLDAERTLYSTFVAAANSMSQLYSQAVQQQRKSSAAASRQTLERMLGFLLREYAGSDVIPKAAILQFLQQEYENVEGSENLPHQFPVQFLPAVSQGHMPGEENQQPHAVPMADPLACKPAHVPGRQFLSPSAKRANSSTGPISSYSAMETTEHDRHMEASTLGPAFDTQNNFAPVGGRFAGC